MENINAIELLDSNSKNAQIIERLNVLTTYLKGLEAKTEERSGPKSTRQMTEDDAKRILLGDLKDKSHGECATQLGLSYGQIYSARKGFTFKPIYKEAESKAKTAVTA